MFKKNKYYLMLFAAVIVFLIAFIIMYYVITMNNAVTQDLVDETVTQNERSIDVIAPYQSEEVTIGIGTQVKLLLVDDKEKVIETKLLDPLTLMGLNEERLKQKFESYELTQFTKDQVVLKKVLEIPAEQIAYTLGVQNHYICIVENGQNKVYTRLNILATHFSRAIYSELLKERISITPIQRDKLLDDAAYIETILQSYEEE